ncbi:MAG TPA: ABC transporter substrate-binding protein [Bacteroidia bacterium]|nr:ABC transporter substrate-binding protein [Bacteroidia bacterium]
MSPGNFYRLFIAVSFILFELQACGDGKKNATEGNVFRFNELGEVRSLDPAMGGSFEDNWALTQLYNGLVEMDTDLFVQPCIAKSWEISEDGMKYTFHLRNDVFFQDSPQFPGGKGRKVTSADFVFSFERLFDKRFSNASTLVEKIVHDPAQGKYGFTAPDDSTLDIQLRMPFRPFLGILTMKFFSVVPKEVVSFFEAEFGRNPIGTGPFRLKFWHEKNNLVFEKNPGYFKFDEIGVRLPYLDLVSVTFIKNPESAYMQLLAGDQDMISGIDAINREKTLGQDGKLRPGLLKRFVLQSAPFIKTDYLAILVDPKIQEAKKSPLSLLYVRQAINYAIDRKKIVRYRRSNLGTPANAGFIPPEMHAYDPAKLEGFSYNPDKARLLLSKANYPGGKGMPTIRLTTTASYLDIADEIKHQLNEIGITVNIETMMPGAYVTAAAEGDLLFFRKSWICDYPDPENFMSLFYSKHFAPAGANYTHFSDKEFDRLYERCLVEPNDSLRAELFLRMDQIIVDQAPVVPLYYDRVVRLVSKKVEGFMVDPTNSMNLERVRLR